MEITSSAISPTVLNPYQPNTTSTATPTQLEQADSVSISAEAVQRAANASLQEPGEKIEPGPTPFP